MGKPLEKAPVDGRQLDPASGRRSYQRPTLTRYGDMRTMTLGGSPGEFDSGGGVFTQNPLD